MPLHHLQKETVICTALPSLCMLFSAEAGFSELFGRAHLQHVGNLSAILQTLSRGHCILRSRDEINQTHIDIVKLLAGL
jgi:hypothetical protein